ncbi:hypothetical protein QBC38DRAFT_489606 [Podospora fimiseda]|uniref:Uncharacterized protein n=1 Tax=Podospora fimiseda TaxID=252190 RepID=A0AAN7BG77_9PEZI|nr:hypothetical protein QBC38DRAFT_489606 [Podospora fimiseda]
MQGPVNAHGHRGYEANAVLFSSYPASPALSFEHHNMGPLKTNWPETSADVDGVSPISVEGPQDPWTSSSETAHQDTSNYSPPDPVCHRISILAPRQGDRLVTKEGFMPSWSPERIEILCSMSRFIWSNVNELRSNPDSRWLLPLKDEDGFDPQMALRVLDMIGPDTKNRRQRVSLLSQECNVLWVFQVIPKMFPRSQTWEVLDDDGYLAATRTMVRKAAQSYTGSVSGSSSMSSSKWGWHSEPAHRSRLTSLQLANVALVLEWEEVFKREIKTVVWDWTGTQATIVTPVERLRSDGENGLDARRKSEKQMILREIKQYLDRVKTTHKGSVKRLLRDLEAQNMQLESDSFLHPSSYSMLREIESAILKEPWKQRNGGAASVQRAVNPNRPAAPGLLGKIKDLEHGVENLMSGGKAHRKFVEGLLRHIDEFLAQRQAEVGGEIWRWRDGIVAAWLKC